jgi:hypothetical protein
MKISSIPKSGRKGSVVYVKSRYGKVARPYVRPRNPRTKDQQRNRNRFDTLMYALYGLTEAEVEIVEGATV